MLVLDQMGDRTVRVEIDTPEGPQEIEFWIGPGDFSAVMGGFIWARGQSLALTEDPQMLGVAAGYYALIHRVKAWGGVADPDGQPLPCTLENKMLLFGRFPQALFSLGEKLAESREAERKNLTASRSGSDA